MIKETKYSAYKYFKLNFYIQYSFQPVYVFEFNWLNCFHVHILKKIYQEIVNEHVKKMLLLKKLFLNAKYFRLPLYVIGGSSKEYSENSIEVFDKFGQKFVYVKPVANICERMNEYKDYRCVRMGNKLLVFNRNCYCGFPFKVEAFKIIFKNEN